MKWHSLPAIAQTALRQSHPLALLELAQRFKAVSFGMRLLNGKTVTPSQSLKNERYFLLAGRCLQLQVRCCPEDRAPAFLVRLSVSVEEM
jgi:hypothetical protein